MKRILMTGASGNLGRALRAALSGWVDELRLSDIAPIDDLAEGESFVQCDLGDYDSVQALLEGCDGVIHLGGISIEGTFDSILNGNIRGTYNIYEACRRLNVSRVVFASSNHVIGFHDRETLLDADSAMRPDSMYGVSKGFGELLARYYYDKYGVESALVRIGWCGEKPLDRRTMSTWLSVNDFSRLIKTVFSADRLGCPVVYGVSDNASKWWDNRKVNYLGWHPEDSSDVFAQEPYILDEVTDPNDPAIRFQGGGFAAAGHFED
ncbi:MAG: NAD-dependent epimerase/dehydratase family protein [Pontibacterium sp.]